MAHKKNNGRKKRSSKIVRKYYIEDLMQYVDMQNKLGVDVDTSTVYLIDEIMQATLHDFIIASRSILKLRDIKFENEPITILLSSYGGDLYSMFGIMDFIKFQKVKFDMIAIGPVISAGAFLFVGGCTGKRYATKNASFMFHQISAESPGSRTASNAIRDAEQIKYLSEKLLDILANHTKRDRDFWDKNIREDFYLTAEQALELGVVDDII